MWLQALTNNYNNMCGRRLNFGEVNHHRQAWRKTSCDMRHNNLFGVGAIAWFVRKERSAPKR
jgi:hypothetical protein